MPKLILLKGLPGSGKSTRGRDIVEKSGNTVRINRDLLRTMLHYEKWTGNNEDLTRKASRHLAKLFLSAGVNVLIDDTNLNEKTLQSWKGLAKELNVKFDCVDLTDVSVEECVKRDSLREKRVGPHVIRQMALQHLDYLKGENVVVSDLDGTICDITHRLHFVKGLPEGQKKDWKGFFDAIPSDKMRLDVVQKIVQTVEENNAKLILVSARPENYRLQTELWLMNHIEIPRYEVLIMRSAGDRRDDTEVKSDIYDKFLKKLNIIKVFDDRPRVIRAWREKGLEVEDVGNGEEF